MQIVETPQEVSLLLVQKVRSQSDLELGSRTSARSLVSADICSKTRKQHTERVLLTLAKGTEPQLLLPERNRTKRLKTFFAQVERKVFN